jgi:hypothetical protein
MSKSLITLAAALIATGAAFAGEADPSGQFALQIPGQRTRAEVNAEVVSAVAAGQLRPSNPHASAYVQPQVHSTQTRQQVVAEFLADREEAQALNSEDSGSAYLARAGNAVRANQYLANAQ